MSTDWIITTCGTQGYAGDTFIVIPYVVTVQYQSPSVYLVNLSNQLTFTVNISNYQVDYNLNTNQYISVTVYAAPVGADVICDQPISSPNSFTIDITFINNFNGSLPNDKYLIKFDPTTSNPINYSVVGTRVKTGHFSAVNGITNNTETPENNNDIVNVSQCCNKKVAIPILIIEGQTLFDATDLADMKFTISDIYCYYDNKSIIGTKCCKFYAKPKKLNDTIFRKCCNEISLYPVLKGKGCTALDKALYIYNHNKKLQENILFNEFYYNNLILYAMSKYILSYLLYGKFSMKYVLNEYNKEFFKNLKNSRFCEFAKLYKINHIKHYNKFFH